MPNELTPLFLFSKDGEEELQQAGVVITTEEGPSYTADSFIATLAKEIEDGVKDLALMKEVGELTAAGYLVGEALCRIGMNKVADEIMENPQMLFNCALCCAIGMRAGNLIDAGVKFETVTTHSDSSIRHSSSE